MVNAIHVRRKGHNYFLINKHRSKEKYKNEKNRKKTFTVSQITAIVMYLFFSMCGIIRGEFSSLV